MKAFASVAVMALLVTGCAAVDSPERARSRTVLVCDTYARSLSTLAVYRQQGRLSPEQVAKVNSARPFFNEACAADAEPIGPQTLDMLETKLLEMSSIQVEVVK